MAASNWTVTDHAKEGALEDMDFNSDSFVCRLYSSSSNLSEGSTTTGAGVTGELSTANGYTNGGVACTVTCTLSGDVVMIDETTNPSWTASGGSITARFAAIVNTTTGDVLCFCLLDDTPADVVVTDTNSLTITQNANGLVRYTYPS